MHINQILFAFSWLILQSRGCFFVSCIEAFASSSVGDSASEDPSSSKVRGWIVAHSSRQVFEDAVAQFGFLFEVSFPCSTFVALFACSSLFTLVYWLRLSWGASNGCSSLNNSLFYFFVLISDVAVLMNSKISIPCWQELSWGTPFTTPH